MLICHDNINLRVKHLRLLQVVINCYAVVTRVIICSRRSSVIPMVPLIPSSSDQISTHHHIIYDVKHLFSLEE